MDNNITFSKIVATPTLNSWSQAYHAGKLFAVLSLEKTQESNQDLESLNLLGKDLLEKLEQEFFTIEEKNLESIKTAITNTFQNSIEGINISFAASAFINNILYLFALGKAKIFMKREGNFGLVLDSKENSKDIISSSGFLKNNDLIVLSTKAFSEVITQEDLSSNLTDSLPSEITESLAPKIHKAENGKISAIVIKYGNPVAEEILDEGIAVQEEVEQEKEIDERVSPFAKYLSILKSKFAWLKKPNIKINPTRKLFLIAAIIIVGILIFSIFLGIQKQQDAKMHALFTQVYAEAQKKYDVGQSLADLNKNLSRDAFVSAQKILNDNKDKFPAKSKEAIQAQELLKKVEEGLAQVSPVDKSGLDRSKLSVTVQNGSGTEGVAGKGANILKELGYNVASTGNADNYNYQGVTIKVKSSKSDFLNLLKQDLSKDYSITASSSDLSSDSPTDAMVIIGK
ncbi:MAG: LytR C-terminal domain-containing protein [bacterium]|nr:LytR C-terminal domain-containing protein [bacterium]